MNMYLIDICLGCRALVLEEKADHLLTIRWLELLINQN